MLKFELVTVRGGDQRRRCSATGKLQIVEKVLEIRPSIKVLAR